MRRRPLTLLLSCAALTLAGTAAASAQDADPSTAVAAPTGAPTSLAVPASTVAPAPAAAPSSTTVPAVSGPTPGPTTNDSTAPIILLAAVGLVLLLAALLWGAARWWAWEPRWVLRSRHAAAEAGWRTSNSWAEFRDWIRVGR